MITDVTLLKIFLRRDNLDAYISLVKWDALQPEAKIVLNGIKAYYEAFPVEVVEIDKFKVWFHQVYQTELSDSRHQIYAGIFDRLEFEDIEEDEEFYKLIFKHFQEVLIKNQIKELITEDKSLADIAEVIDQSNVNTTSILDASYMPFSGKQIFARLARDSGLKWRLGCLNAAIGVLIPGDFGVVAGPPGAGKSAFVYSELSYMAQQLTEGSVLLFNNEGLEERAGRRIVTATLGITDAEYRDNWEALDEQYEVMMNGDMERVKIFDANSTTVKQIEFLIKKHDARLVVVDMADKLRHKSAHQIDAYRLGDLYDKLRIAARLCPIIVTSQTDDSNHYVHWQTKETIYHHYLKMHQLAKSHIDKQAAADYVITIGWDPKYPYTRFIHTPKNKLPGDGHEENRFIEKPVGFDPERAQYSDI